MVLSADNLSIVVFEKLFDAIADMAKALIKEGNFDEATKCVLTTSISSICDVLSTIRSSSVDNKKKKVNVPKKTSPTKTPSSTRTGRQYNRGMQGQPLTGNRLLSKASKTPKQVKSPKILPLTTAENSATDDTVDVSNSSQTPGHSSNRTVTKHLKLAVRPKSMFLTGLDIETTTDDIKEYASQFFDNDVVSDLKILKINSRSNTYISFKLFCPPDLFEEFLSMWKNEGISARPFTDDYVVNHSSKTSSPSKN